LGLGRLFEDPRRLPHEPHRGARPSFGGAGEAAGLGAEADAEAGASVSIIATIVLTGTVSPS